MVNAARKRHVRRFAEESESIFANGSAVCGVWMTCPDSREKFAVRDAYRLLNDAFTRQFAAEAQRADADVDEQVHRALNGDSPPLKAKQAFKFQQIKVRARGVIFIVFNVPELQNSTEAKQFVNEIIDESLKLGVRPSRCIFRFVPIERAFKASVQNFERHLRQMVAVLPTEEGCTWSIKYKCRNNSEFKRESIYATCHQLMPDNFHFQQNDGEFVLFIDVSQNLMCMSLLDQFETRNNYSLNMESHSDSHIPATRTPVVEERREDRSLYEESSFKGDIDLF